MAPPFSMGGMNWAQWTSAGQPNPSLDPTPQPTTAAAAAPLPPPVSSAPPPKQTPVNPDSVPFASVQRAQDDHSENMLFIVAAGAIVLGLAYYASSRPAAVAPSRI
jgi:hypothetical protein